jgi:hypothetical protein
MFLFQGRWAEGDVRFFILCLAEGKCSGDNVEELLNSFAARIFHTIASANGQETAMPTKNT